MRNYSYKSNRKRRIIIVLFDFLVQKIEGTSALLYTLYSVL
nr:MAG TPA: hypothetical protein [Caudoviricetes sp.]